MSHACGVGDPLPTEVVRAMMLLRIHALARGRSGIRLETLEMLVAMLDEGVHPIVPELGSVGSSGDLCPLAHMSLPLIGRGEVEYRGERLPAAEALARVGLTPKELTYKEGIALLNGTQAMTSMGLVAAVRFARALDIADLVGAMSLEAIAGRLEALDERLHRARGRDGQIRSAANVRALLAGSELAGIGVDALEGKSDYVQDSYSVRCMPQVHGACRDVWTHVVDVLLTEAHAVTDNPLVFVPEGEEPGAILSGGNFHGQPVGMAMDYLKTAISEISSISERRCAKLVDRHHSEGLPAFLAHEPGLDSGMMVPQYVAASLVTRNKTRAFPATVDSIPTSAGEEDHNSMGAHAALGALEMLVDTERVLGIELLIAGQALDLRPGELQRGAGTGRALASLRERVDFLEEDRVMYPDIEAAVELVRSGALHGEVREFLQPYG
jgi:histidine ammonia-lyase